MKLRQKYIRNRLKRVQERAVRLSARDKALRTDIILQSEFSELREFMREDLEQTDFGLRSGLRYAREMESLCSSYAVVVATERMVYNARCRHYIEEVLEPELAEYGYNLIGGTLGSSEVAFRQPDDSTIRFPRGEEGVYQCEKLLAELAGEEWPPFDLLEVRERVEKCCPRSEAEDAEPEKTDD